MIQKIRQRSSIKVLFLSILFMISCSNEETIDLQLTEIQQLQSKFSLEHFNDVFVKNNLEIDWNDFRAFEDIETNTYSYEFNTTSKIKNTLQNEKQKLEIKYKLLALKNEANDWELEIVKFISEDIKKLRQISFFSLDSFSGTLYRYDLEGNTVSAKVYINGEIISTLPEETLKTENLTARAPDGSGWVLIWIESWTDWYENNGAGGAFQYTHSTYNGSRSEYVFVEGNGYTGYDYTNSGEYHEHFDAPHGATGTYNHPEEIIIDTSFINNLKINCTYKQLLKNTTIKQLLQAFFGNDADFDLIFQVGAVNCNGNNVEGCTANYLDVNGTIKTTIDQDYINSSQTPTLFIAQTIIHEAIHANLYLALYNHNSGSSINLPDINDFPAIYEEYRQLKGWQHEFMADHYVELVAQTLQEIHPLLNDQAFINSINNNFPDLSLEEFYTSIAYLGLNGTAGQTDFLSHQENSDNYNISFYEAQTNSTKTPNCN